MHKFYQFSSMKLRSKETYGSIICLLFLIFMSVREGLAMLLFCRKIIALHFMDEFYPPVIIQAKC